MIAPGNHVIEKSAALCNTPGGGNVVRCKIKQLNKSEFEAAQKKLAGDKPASLM